MSVVIRIGQISATLALAAAALVLLPDSAQAYVPHTPPCYGASCVGKDPNITNRDGESCASGVAGANNGKTTLETAFAGDGGSVNLRWSAFCGANWAQFVTTSSAQNSYWAETWNGHRETPEGSGYTFMVDGTQLAEACIDLATFGDATARCTSWH